MSWRALSLFLFRFFWLSLVPVPLFISVESENTGQTVLTLYCIDPTRFIPVRVDFFLNPEISGLALSLILVRFNFWGSS